MNFKNKERDPRWAIDIYQADREKTFLGYSTKKPCARGDHARIAAWPDKSKGCLQCLIDDISVVRNRSLANVLGQTYYRAAQPCPKGHDAVRYVSTNQCVECTREYASGNLTTRIPAAPLSVITRDQARAEGRSKFYTGIPCVRGHSVERYVSTGICIECLVESRKGVVTPKVAPIASPSGITRAQARAAGFLRYTSQSPCGRCAGVIRYVSNNVCVECNNK